MSVRILQADSAAALAKFPDESVNCCVTSPPYWQLRDYGHPAQLGLEATPDAYVEALVGVMRQVRRVLRKDGTLWVNLGDTYIGGRCGGRGSFGVTSGRNHDACRAVRAAMGGVAHKQAPGLKPKDLVGIPWRVALALQGDGWYLRSEIIWEKPSALPESCRDRPTRSHEHVFLLARSRRYYYDAEAVKEPVTGNAHTRGKGDNPKARKDAPGSRQNTSWSKSVRGLVEKRNLRTVWKIPQEPYRGKHTSTFPKALVRPCILAGTAPGGMVLDPFAGIGTTGFVADELGRNAVLIDISRESCEEAVRRIKGSAPLVTDVELVDTVEQLQLGGL